MENTVWFAQTASDDLSGEVRRLLARALGFVPQIEKGERGKPFLPERPEMHIGLSHTRGAVACAVFACPVGLDLERMRPVNPALAKRYFTAAEQLYAEDDKRFLEVWTRKEALLKRDGDGLTQPLAALETQGTHGLETFWHGDFVLSVCAGEPYRFLETKL